jgi:hypothetical protein
VELGLEPKGVRTALNVEKGMQILRQSLTAVNGAGHWEAKSTDADPQG